MASILAASNPKTTHQGSSSLDRFTSLSHPNRTHATRTATAAKVAASSGATTPSRAKSASNNTALAAHANASPPLITSTM